MYVERDVFPCKILTLWPSQAKICLKEFSQQVLSAIVVYPIQEVIQLSVFV